MLDQPIECWTPKLVDKQLVEAVRLVVAIAGPVGPRAYRSAMPVQATAMSWNEFLLSLSEAGGEAAEATEERRRRVGATAQQITRMEQALRWPVTYLPDHDGPRRVLAVYLRCRAYRKPFGGACKRLQWPRATAYRARDKALSMIAQGLERDHVEVWR